MKRVLMLAYYFPPLGMSGTQRPAKFARYLAEFGWQPTVLTVKPIAYWAEDPTLLDELAGVEIVRAGSFDPQRLLALLRRKQAPDAATERGTDSGSRQGAVGVSGLLAWINRRLLPWVLLPDSKILWSGPARRAAAGLLRSGAFSAIWSTSPPHSTHLIARRLARRFHLPWIADFRDAWADSVVVASPTSWHRRRQAALLRRVAREADLLVGVTPGIVAELAVAGAAGKSRLLTNGFDAADFPAPGSPPGSPAAAPGSFVLLHCGTISRFSDPAPLFAALRPAEAGRLRIHFIGHDARTGFAARLREHGLQEIITWTGYQPHHQALAAMAAADALLLIACDEPQARFIPGKSFEYLASRKPILLISNVAETRALLEPQPGVITCAPDQPAAIRAALDRLQQDPGLAQAARQRELRPFDRREQSARLAAWLDTLHQS